MSLGKILSALFAGGASLALAGATVTGSASAAAAHAKAHVVTITSTSDGMQYFNPTIMTVSHGQSVEWINKTHGKQGAHFKHKWTTGWIKPHHHVTRVFKNSGRYTYTALAGSASGTLTVK